MYQTAMDVVSAPHIHEHSMVLSYDMGKDPMLMSFDVRKGDCCGRSELSGDNYYCHSCDFLVHRKCCGVSVPHIHEHFMVPWDDLRKGDCCGGFETSSDGYYCKACDYFVHRKCGGVSLPLIHKHLLLPWNDMRKGDCCGGFETSSDGYFCKACDFFAHKECCEPSEYLEHPSHPKHTLLLQICVSSICNLCGKHIWGHSYNCIICGIAIDLLCAKYPPPEVINTSEAHCHTLTLVKEKMKFSCDAKCGEVGDGYSYKCHVCNVTFHIDCVWQPSEVKHPSEVNHSYHPLHLLKLLKGEQPSYSDGKCRLCGRKVDKYFYHCSSCNFTLDLRCVLNPPPQSLLDLKTHEHHLTLLPKFITFTCSACGLSGDRSPYVCIQCGFMIHRDCFALPRLININRHDHRVSYTCLLGVVNSVCGVCHLKVDWTCGVTLVTSALATSFIQNVLPERMSGMEKNSKEYLKK